MTRTTCAFCFLLALAVGHSLVGSSPSKGEQKAVVEEYFSCALAGSCKRDPILADTLASDDVDAADRKVLAKMAKKAAKLAKKALAKGNKTPSDFNNQAIGAAGKQNFPYAALYFQVAALVSQDVADSGQYWGNSAIALMDWAMTERQWGVAKASAKMFEVALAAGGPSDSIYNNLKSLHKLIESSFKSELAAGHCNSGLCPEFRTTAERKAQMRRERLFRRPDTLEARRKQQLIPASQDPLCLPTDGMRVPVSDAERDGGFMKAETLEHAAAVIEACGVVVLDNVYDPETIQEIADAQEIEFEHARATGLLNDSTVTVNAGKTGRYNVKTPYKEPYIGEAYANNPLVMAVLDEAMGGAGNNDVEIATLSHVTSLPRSPMGNWHVDHPTLFSKYKGRNLEMLQMLPAHAVIAIVPLVNVTLEMGPTRFLLKSHIPCRPDQQVPVNVGNNWQLEECPAADLVLDGVGGVGTAILFDMRLMHQGSGNNSPKLRPTMYTTYAHKWFFDSVNWNTKHTASYDELPGAMRRRLSRLDTDAYTKLLESMLEERGVDTKALQSSYFFDKVDVTLDRGIRNPALVSVRP